MFVPEWAKTVRRIEIFANDTHWRGDENTTTPRLHRIRHNIPDGHCWAIRNGLYWDGETIELVDVFRVYRYDLPETPNQAVDLDCLGKLGWKEE